MGFEDWENRYRGQAKPQLGDFLDEEEESVILRMGRNPPQQTFVHQKAPQSAFLPTSYPEGYETIDRRRKKRIREPGGLLRKEADRVGEGFPSDLELPHEKRGEVFLRQVAEMQEEEERMASCLRPYRNGLLYKTRMWAKNEVDTTLENYVAFKKEQDARRKSRFEFDFQSSEELQFSFESEEEMDDLPLAEEDFPPENSHYKDRFSYFDGHLENGLREKKGGKAKIGGWVAEAMLSPVEEPSDEYVDTMDELQCLVESVSEYLAEKEEEISKYGSLPKSSKSRLSSQGSYRAESFGEDPNNSSQQAREEPRTDSHTSDQSVSGVKNAMSSLFSSITKGVGGGTKKSAPPPAAPSAPPSQSGLTKLLFFIPKSSSSAPVAVVSPVESSPEKSFGSLPSQTSLKTKTQVDNHAAQIPLKNPTEYESRGQGSPQNSALGKLDPRKLFSSGDHVSWTSGCPQWNQSHACKGAEVETTGEKNHLGPKPEQRTINRQNPTSSRQENGPSSGPARTTSQGQSANVGFFSPLKKSLSSLISPVAPVQPQAPVAVYPVFQSTEDPRPGKPADAGNFKPPFRSPDDIPAQHRPRAQGGPPGPHKFASSEDVRACGPTQNRASSCPDSTAVTSASSTQSSAWHQESTERSWLSGLFNPTSAAPTVNQTYPSNQNPQNSSGKPGSHAQHVSDQNRAAGESQSFLTGLFKGHSAEDVSQPKQGGLLSGLLKFGSTSDISAEATQRSSSLLQNPTEASCSLPQPSEAQRQRNISQEASQELGTQPQQRGLLSGLLKFASTENISSSQPSQQRDERNLNKNPPGPSSGSQLINRQFSQRDGNQEISKPGFSGEQSAPIQQPASQQSGILSGLFKFASADNVNAQQQSPCQQSQMTASKSTHGGTVVRNNSPSCENQPPGGSTQKPGGLFSGLFKSSTENVAQPQQQQQQQQPSRNSQEMQPTKELSSQSTEAHLETPGVLSGLFNKLTKSERTDTCPSRASSDRASGSAVRTKTQMHASVTQQSSLEGESKERRIPTTGQQGFLSGLFNKALTAEPLKQSNAPHVPPAKLTEIPPKSVSTDLTQSHAALLSGSSHQRHSRHASLGGPATMDSETLDLRTSATFARSLQSQSKYSSASTGNLSHLGYSEWPPSAQPVAYSTGNIHSLLQHQTSPLMSTHAPAYGSSSSQSSPYGVSPSYDENQWIRQSVFWQHFQNESLNFQVQSADQVMRQSDEGPAFPGSTHRHSFSNIYQPYNSSTHFQGACHQDQTETYPSDEQRNFDTLSKKKLWNSYEDLGNFEYTSSDYGALNLTTNQSNSNVGKFQSFSNESSYSLNGVSYHEGYYEEMPPNLSYSANWQYGVNDTGQQNFHNEFQNQFKSNGLILSGRRSSAKSEAESLYLEDIEWYQQWLSLLEQGMWWPAEDRDCGYFVYTDHEYIYALLTDAAGEYVYVCTPEGESWGDAQRDGLPSAWLHSEMVCVCGFKIPLSNEDELLWLPGQHDADSQLLNAPLDLSTAYKKGNQIMNLNLEQFSQMFENSFLSQCQRDTDFTSYTLNKVKMDPRQPPEDQCNDIIDLSCRRQGHISNSWNNCEIKTLLSQKVAVSLNSSPTTYPNHQLLHNCYQPSQRRRTSTGVTVKHVDDVLEEEWRRRVSPGEEVPNRQVKKISSLISSFATKASQGEPNKSRPSSDDQKSKNILSSGLHSLKSKIMKDEPAVVATEPPSVKQPGQKAATTQGRLLPTTPTAAGASQASTQPHSALPKTRLSRQSTVEQPAAPPPQPHGQVPASKATNITEEKPSDQPQTGLMNFIKSAVRIEEPKLDPQIGPKASLHQQRNSDTNSSQGSAPSSKEATGVANIFGSISSLFSSEPSSPQTQVKQSFTESSLASVNAPKGLQRQQTVNQSGLSHPTQSQPPNRSVSQVFQSPRPSTGFPTSKSESLAPTEQPKNEGAKPSSGFFGFSLGEMLSGSTSAAQSGTTPHTTSNSAPQEESLGKSLLSIISGPSQNQSSPRTEPVPQASQSQTESQPSQAESVGKSILSLFGGSSITSQPPQSKPPAEVSQQGAVPPKESANTGFLSIFSGPSTQQSQGQTGSLLGGLLSGSSSSTESPVKGLFSIFGDPTPPQTQPPTSSSQRGTAQSPSQQKASQPEPKPQAQPQPSVLGGILGGLSSSNESPKKSLFSMFGSSGPTQTSGVVRSTDLSTPKGTSVPKEPANKPGFNDVSLSPLGTIPRGKEPPNSSLQQGSSEKSSASTSHLPVPEVPCETSAVDQKPSSDLTINTAPQAGNTESINDQKEISSQAPLNVPPSKHPHDSSILPGSGPQTPSSQDPSSTDTTKNVLPPSCSGPGAPGPLPEVPAPEPSGPKDTSVKSLFSVFGGSATQPSPQSGGSLLGAMFGASSAQPSASQTGGSLLGGLFAGSAPPPKSGGGAPQAAGPPSGTSVLGGLFGGSTTQAAGSQTASSILGGLFGGSAASTTGPQQSHANQTKLQNATSVFGGILGGSFQPSKEQTAASLLGGIFSGTPAASEAPEKSQTPASIPPSAPLPAPPSSSDVNKTCTTLTDTISGVTPEIVQDGFQTVLVSGSCEQTADNIAQTKTQEEALQQPDRTAPSSEENVPKEDVCISEGLSQKTDDAQSKEPDTEAQTQPPEAEVVSVQLSQDISESKLKQENATSPVSPALQKPISEAEKPVADSSTDAVKGFMASLFKPAAAATEGPQQPQKTSLFGGAEAANSQAGSSLLGGIFGGSTTDTAAPQTGGSLLGGLFKGSGSQTQASHTGGSILGGMFGGGPPAAASGQQSGGSVLSGMFGGPAAPAQPAGSLLSGIFGGASAQTDSAQTGTSVLGGLGGSLFGGVGRTSKPSEPIHVESKPAHRPSAQLQGKNESLIPKLSPSSTDTDTTKPVDSQKIPDQEQPTLQRASTAVVSDLSPENSSASPSTTSEPIKDESEKEKPAVGGEVIHVKPPVLPKEAQSPEGPSAHAEPPPVKSVFGFMSTPPSAGKSLSSLFSPTLASVPLSVAQSEGATGLLSGLKTFSGGLFQEEKSVPGKQEPPTASLFGTKLSFPWQTEQKTQAPPVIASQPASQKDHTEQTVPPPDAPKIESVGSADQITAPEICISTPDVAPSATLTPEEKETVLERPPSAGPPSGVQLDKQPNMELLNAKRLVEA